MKKVIVGLGNPDEEYQFTRHNTGFLFIDFLIGNSPDILATVKKFKEALIYAYNDDVLLVKPLTYMNNSGEMVKEVVKWFEIEVAKDLIVVHDDLDILLGRYKVQFAKTPRDHKGLLSIEQHLGTTQFSRLRIGIENRQSRQISGDEYVLGNFSNYEMEKIEGVFEEIVEKEAPFKSLFH